MRFFKSNMASFTAPIDIEKVDVSKITFSLPKDDKSNTGFISYNGGTLRVKMPKMMVQFSAKPFTQENTEPKDTDNISVSLSLETADTCSKEIGAARKKFEEINERIVDLLVENHKKIFGKDKDLDNLKTVAEKRAEIGRRYKKRIITYADNTDDNKRPRPDTLKLRVRRDRQNPKKLPGIGPKPLLIDKKGKEIPVDAENIGKELCFGREITPIVDASHYTYIKATQQFYVVLRLSHALCYDHVQQADWSLVDPPTEQFENLRVKESEDKSDVKEVDDKDDDHEEADTEDAENAENSDDADPEGAEGAEDVAESEEEPEEEPEEEEPPKKVLNKKRKSKDEEEIIIEKKKSRKPVAVAASAK